MAEVTIDVGVTGDAGMQLSLAPEHEEELRTVAEGAAEAVFPGAGADVTIDENDGGFPFASVSASDVYEPSDRPEVHFATADLQQGLAEAGLSRVYVAICWPHVPTSLNWDVEPSSTDGQCASWTLTGTSTAPAVTLAMRPEPARWWAAMGRLVVSAIATVIAAWAFLFGGQSRRRLVLLRVSSAIGILAGVADIGLAGATQGDNLAVAGQLDGFALNVANVAPVVTFLLAAACVGLLIVSWARRPERPAGADLGVAS